MKLQRIVTSMLLTAFAVVCLVGIMCFTGAWQSAPQDLTVRSIKIVDTKGRVRAYIGLTRLDAIPRQFTEDLMNGEPVERDQPVIVLYDHKGRIYGAWPAK